MNKDEFVRQIKAYRPAREIFEKYGYANNVIEKKIKRYDCIPREKTEILQQNVNSEILKLLHFYDCSNIQIGVLEFVENIEETENFFIIGKMEADILVLSKVTLEIQVVDHLDFNWVICSCAANSESFLDALVLCVEYFAKGLDNPQLAMDSTFTFDYVLQCSEKAGGEKYIDFYKMLLGYFE